MKKFLNRAFYPLLLIFIIVAMMVFKNDLKQYSENNTEIRDLNGYNMSDIIHNWVSTNIGQNATYTCIDTRMEVLYDNVLWHIYLLNISYNDSEYKENEFILLIDRNSPSINIMNFERGPDTYL